MTLFFSRRAFDARTGLFSQNAASLTRYVRVGTPAEGVSKANLLEAGDWFAAVEAEAESGDVVIWVHGFNTSQGRMLERQRQLARDLRAEGYRGALVGFDWPSDGFTLRYRADRNDAKRVAPALVTDALIPLGARPRGLRVHVLAQSMGTYVVLRGFSGVGDRPGARPWSAEQVLFTGADVDSRWLQKGAWGGLVMERRARRLTNYYNTRDSVLELSGGVINFGSERAGRVGLPKAPPANAVDMRCTERYRAIAPEGQNNLFLSHNWYFEDRNFLADAVKTLAGTADNAMPGRLNVSNGDRALRP